MSEEQVVYVTNPVPVIAMSAVVGGAPRVIRVRRCVRCQLPITFSFLEIPIMASKRNPRVIAVFFVHETSAGCESERRRLSEPGTFGDVARANAARVAELDAAGNGHERD